MDFQVGVLMVYKHVKMPVSAHTVAGTLATIAVYYGTRVLLSTARFCSVPEGADPTNRYVYYELSGCTDLLFEAPPLRLYSSPFSNFFKGDNQTQAWHLLVSETSSKAASHVTLTSCCW